jgi:GH15 family glucan-1,4-alpha-glucosidase
VARVRRAKNAWWREWLAPADLPKGAPAPVVRLAKRSLITLRQVTDTQRSMMVASIATQAPYGLDWIRNGLYMNRALHRAGHSSTVEEHNVRYGGLQSTAADPPQGQPATPAGNWAHNYYADGVAGGPLPYTIDQTGYGIWTLWDHYDQTNDNDYLLRASVYEAIQRAAHYLSDPPPTGCTDPTTGLQCFANEGDNEALTRTLVGAQAVWAGLGAAASAAEVRGGAIAEGNVVKWSNRQADLGDAIEANFFDEECNCYTQDYETGGALLWPVRLRAYGSERANAQAAVNYEHMTGILTGEVTTGRYESKMLLGNAFAWDGTRQMAKVRDGLRWVARVPTTDRTDLLGESWMVYPPEGGRVTTMVSQPHAPSHAMFYLAALKTWGAARYSFD